MRVHLQLSPLLACMLPGAAVAPWTRHLTCSFSSTAPAASAALAFEDIVGSTATSSGEEGTASSMTAVLLHGLLGSGRNWRSFAKRLVTDAETHHGVHLRLLLLDLRNHGQSSGLTGLHPPHNMEAAAGDVIRFMQGMLPRSSAPFALIGHSLGGKVAMEAVRLLAESNQALPQQTWVLDAQPGVVLDDMEQQTGVAGILEMVHEVKLPVPSRQALLEHLRSRGLSQATALWLGSNLVPDARGQLGWAFQVQGAAAMYHSYRSTDCWGVLEQPVSGVEMHLVRGALSDRWSPELIQRTEAAAAASASREAALSAPPPAGAQAGSFHYHVLEKAGHNLHVDNAPGLQQLMLQQLMKGREK